MQRFAIVAGLALLALGPLGVGSAADRPLAGDLDPSFGNSGIVSLGSHVGGIAVQPDGKIVVAGDSTAGVRLARYLPTGSPDSSFGDGGVVETQVERWPFTAAHGVALQSDGKIVVAGSSRVQGDDSNFSVFTLARYNPNGSLDTSFGTDGVAKTAVPEPGPFAGTEGGARSLAILPGGKILAAGGSNWSYAGGRASEFVLVEYTPNGSLDATFGDGGIAQTPFYGDDSLEGIVVRPDGKIVASGTGGLGGHGQDIATMALARYSADGSLDWKVTTAPKLRYEGGPSALLGRKIVVAGETERNEFLVLARYKADGSLDSTFGKHGFVEIKRVTGLPTAVLAQNDRKILIATSGVSDRVARLLPSGRLDTSFGRRGIVSLGWGPHLHLDAPYALALQTDGKVLAGGGGGNGTTLARVVGGDNCVVPGLRGRTVPRAASELKASHCLRGSIARRFSSVVRRARVISTVPARAARLPGGTKVDLIVSKGKRP